jgi:hypothetical protein
MANIPMRQARRVWLSRRCLDLTATAYQKQHELLLFRALDACLGALHHIGRDDVVDELCDERPPPEAAE